MELSSNPMNMSDFGAIKWLESQEDEGLVSAWRVLKSYYEKCKETLASLSCDETYFLSVTEKSGIISNIKEKLTNRVYLEESYELLKEDNETYDDYFYRVSDILNKKNHTKEEESLIIKLQRLYNMNLKLGHTARITYISFYNMELNKKDYEFNSNINFYKKSVLLSSLLHDIGRFYQAAKYNNIDDAFMKKNEEKIDNIEVDHSVAGYYYSIASALQMHKLDDKNADMQAILNFISESVAATVVRYHSMNNNNLSHFECDESDLSLISDNDITNNLYKFIIDGYNNAKLLNCKLPNFDENYKNFIDEFMLSIKNILFDKRDLDYQQDIASTFGVDLTDYNSVYDNLYKEIKECFLNSKEKKAEDILNSIYSVINKYIVKITNTSVLEEEKSYIKGELERMLKEMLNYDIAESIDYMFKNNNVSSDVKFFISSCLVSTMDADKIDILNQRAIGVYNTPYKLTSLRVFPSFRKSFISILSEYFNYLNLDSNDFVIDVSFIKIINSLDVTVRSILREYFVSNNIDVFDDNNFIRNDITSIRVLPSKIFINNSLEIETCSFYDLFARENWIEFLCDKTGLGFYDEGNFHDLRGMKINKDSVLGKFSISIDREVFDKNVSNLSFEEKRTMMKRILISDDLENKFKLERDNPIGVGWISKLETQDSYHITTSSISALLWQINQFIFVNMRNKKSYEFVKNHGILEGILKQYKEQDPEIADILEEYITYAIGFVDYVIEQSYDKEFITSEMLSVFRDDYYSLSRTKKI